MKSSSGRMAEGRATSAMALRKHVLRQVLLKTWSRASQAQVLEKVRAVLRVMLAQTEWPGSARRDGYRFDVQSGDGAGRHRFVLEQISLEQLLNRDDAFPGRVRHGEELATAPHPNVAGGIGHRRVK